MRLYNYTLDGEFLNPAALNKGTDRWTEVPNTQAKLIFTHLFGYDFRLSDMQIWDAPAVTELFGDSDFLTYVERDHPTLFDVKGMESRWSVSGSRLRVVINGPERSLRDGWTDTFGSPKPITDLANAVKDFVEKHDEINKARMLDDATVSQVLNSHPDQRQRLTNILLCLEHFAHRDKVQVIPRERDFKPPTLFEKLEEADIPKDKDFVNHSTALTKTIQTLKSFPQRDFRSEIHAYLKESKIPLQSPEYRMINNTVVYAYCAAQAETVSADGSLVGYLPEGACVPLFLPKQRVGDVVIPVRPSAPLPRLFARFLPHDLTRLTWAQLSGLTNDLRVERARAEFHDVLAGRPGADPEQAFAKLCEALASFLKEERFPLAPSTRMMWLFEVGGAVLALVLGGSPLEGALKGRGAGSLAWETMRSAVGSLDQYVLVNLLREVDPPGLSNSVSPA